MVRSRPFLKIAQTSFSFCGAVSQRKKLRKSTKNDTSFLTGHIRAHYQPIEAFLAVAIFRKVDQNFSGWDFCHLLRLLTSCISRLFSSSFIYFQVKNQIFHKNFHFVKSFLNISSRLDLVPKSDIWKYQNKN